MLERDISITAETLAEINTYLRGNVLELLKIEQVAGLVAQRRLTRETPVAVFQGGGAVMSRTTEHNLQGMVSFSAVTRPRMLINPLLALNSINTRLTELDVLSIGPRTEAEIFSLLATGFAPNRIRALDLLSYSKWIECGDMHHLPFADNSFDVVLMGWVLAYSVDRARACAEALRVARPGAHIAVGCQYVPHTVEEWRAISGHQDYQGMFNCVQDILDLFAPAVGDVVFKSEIDPELRHREGNVITVFRVAK